MSDLLQPVLSSSRVRALKVLEYVYDSPERLASRETSTRTLEDDLGRDGAQGAIRDLVEEGLLKAAEESLVGMDDVSLTSTGEDIVERVRRERHSAARRNGALRDSLLNWIYSRGIGRPTYLHQFLDSDHNQFYGAPFEKWELENASRWLQEKGYIKGQGAGGGGIPRPEITPLGMDKVEHATSVNDPPASGSQHTYNTQIHGPTGNVAMGSSNFTQNSTTTIETAEALAQILATLRQSIDALALDAATRAQLERDLDTAEATDVATNPGLIQEILARTRGVFASGVGGALGSALAGPISEVIALLPG